MGFAGIKWGDDPQRDCQELRRLEKLGIYREGHHLQNCPLDHTAVPDPKGEN